MWLLQIGSDVRERERKNGTYFNETVYVQNGTDMKCYEWSQRFSYKTVYQLFFITVHLLFIFLVIFDFMKALKIMWFDMEPLSKCSSINFEIFGTIRSAQYFEFRIAPNA